MRSIYIYIYIAREREREERERERERERGCFVGARACASIYLQYNECA